VLSFFAFTSDEEDENRHPCHNQAYDRDDERMFVLRDYRKNSAPIMGGQVREKGVSDNSTERQRYQKFLYGILHCAGGKDKWHHRRWRGQ
jgi:hypothetical protein